MRSALPLLLSLSVQSLMNPVPPSSPLPAIVSDQCASAIHDLVLQRTALRRSRAYSEADRIKTLLEKEYRVQLKDYSYKEGGHSTWTVSSEPALEEDSDPRTVMELVRDIETCADPVMTSEVCSLKRKLRNALAALELDQIEESEMLGRKFADAALSLALSGVCDEEVFSLLVLGCASELRRWGCRASCPSLVVLQMVERLAAAGVRDQSVFALAGDILHRRGDGANATIAQLRSGEYSLLALRPLNVLYRHTSRQSKFGKQVDAPAERSECAEEPWDWAAMFEDPALPLVLDLGCGLGVNLLSLASQDQSQRRRPFNYLGCDLAPSSLRYARALCLRWGLCDRLALVRSDVDEAVRKVRASYPGRVASVLVNFPTPYRLHALSAKEGDEEEEDEEEEDEEEADEEGEEEEEEGGNGQLPRSLAQFMVSAPLVEALRELLVEGTTTPLLLVQSNVEDVAVYMDGLVRHSSLFGSSGGFRSMRRADEARELWRGARGEAGAESEHAHWFVAPAQDSQCLRQSRWVQAGGGRAGGPGWLGVNPLGARTETEAAYELQGRPVYRTAYTLVGR